MQVNITYIDNEAYTAEEIKASHKNIFGKQAIVKISPNSEFPTDYLYFAIQQIITDPQLDLYFDYDDLEYSSKLTDLKRGVLARVEQTINKVIIDNEEKLSKKGD